MPEERAVRSVEITVFCHSTEDIDKVKQTVTKITGINTLFEAQSLTGHYDDPITLLRVRITTRESTGLLKKIIQGLSSLDRQILFDNLKSHVDPQGNLYIRLDKQRAYLGKLGIQDSDPIRIKFKIQIPYKADPVEIIMGKISDMVGAPDQ